MAEWQIEQAKKDRFVSSFPEATTQDPKRPPNLSAGGWWIDPASDEGMYARAAFILAVSARLLPGAAWLIEAAENNYDDAKWRSKEWGPGWFPVLPTLGDRNIREIALRTHDQIKDAAAFRGEEGSKEVSGILDRLLSMSSADATESIQKTREEVSPGGIIGGTVDASAEDAGEIATVIREGGQNIYYLISGKKPPGGDPPPRWQVWLTRGAIALGVGGILLYVGRPYVELARESLERFDKDEDEEE